MNVFKHHVKNFQLLYLKQLMPTTLTLMKYNIGDHFEMV